MEAHSGANNAVGTTGVVVAPAGAPPPTQHIITVAGIRLTTDAEDSKQVWITGKPISQNGGHGFSVYDYAGDVNNCSNVTHPPLPDNFFGALGNALGNSSRHKGICWFARFDDSNNSHGRVTP